MKATEMQAGRALDMIVAELVMGELPVPPALSMTEGVEHVWPKGSSVSRPMPHYSTDPAAAWQVVEAMRAKGWCVDIAGLAKCDIWEVGFWRSERNELVEPESVTSRDFPLAVCRAAIAALEAQ